MQLGFGTRLIGLAGAVVLALQFDRGDYLRRAWMLWVGSYVVLIDERDRLRQPGPGYAERTPTQALLSGVLVVIANVALVVGTLMVARAWKAAGLTLTAARSTQIAVIVLSLVVGLVVGGSALWTNAARARRRRLLLRSPTSPRAPETSSASRCSGRSCSPRSPCAAAGSRGRGR